MREMKHPTLDVVCRDDGAVFIPEVKRVNYAVQAHWTYGRKNFQGYPCIYMNGRRYLVHRLIAEAFLENTEGLPTVDHIDRNRSNNSLSNLRWASWSTQNYNRKHRTSKYDIPYKRRTREYQRAYYAFTREHQLSRRKEREMGVTA